MQCLHKGFIYTHRKQRGVNSGVGHFRQLGRHHWLFLTLASDNGKEFANNVCSEFFSLLGSRMHQGAAYHSQSQGQIERQHQTIVEYLRNFVNENTLDWEIHLKPLNWPINTHVHSPTKTSPFFLTFGNYPLQSWEVKKKKTLSETEAVNKFHLLQYAQQVVNKNNDAPKAAFKKQFDKLSKNRSFKVGNSVLVFFKNPPPGVKSKLYRPWSGPYSIKECLNCRQAFRPQIKNSCG